MAIAQFAIPHQTLSCGQLRTVVARNPQDTEQIPLVREHLHRIAQEFRNANFSAPAPICGQAMPGLAELRRARPGEVDIRYQDLDDSGKLRYSTRNAALVAALRRWFDAQLSDHGADAMRVWSLKTRAPWRPIGSIWSIPPACSGDCRP